MTDNWSGNGQIHMGPRPDDDLIASWVVAVVVYIDQGGGSFLYPLNRDQATVMRDRLVQLSAWKPARTAGERYAESKSKTGLRFEFDNDGDGIFLADRGASPSSLCRSTAATMSFKSIGFKEQHVRCCQLTALECGRFAALLSKLLDDGGGVEA